MTTFLIDYENTSFHGLSGIRKINPNDTVVIFLGAKNVSSTMPIKVVRDLTTNGERPRLLWKVSTKTSKNYLDLQLVSYLGSLIGNSDITETEYVIVSKDHDFAAAIDFWAERRSDINISLRPTIAPTPSTVDRPKPEVACPTPQSKTSEAAKRAVRKAVKDLGLKPSVYTGIYRAFEAATTSQQLHDKLTKSLHDQGRKIYPLVKDIHLQLIKE